MVAQRNEYRLTDAEYLALEASSEERHELFAGVVVAMVGASWQHNTIVSNIMISLGSKIRGRGCPIHNQTTRVRSPQQGTYFYPDVVALCGKPALSEGSLQSLLNPTLIIEVLSPSTEQDDRTRKYKAYRMIPSLQEYLLIAQDVLRVESYARRGSGEWVHEIYSEWPDLVPIPSLDAALSLTDLYLDVIAPPETP
jgi:Uma2 family endonuclease